MCAHVLMNLLKQVWEKRSNSRLKMRSIISLFHNKFNKFKNVKFYLSYDSKITLKYHFCG